MPFYFLNKSRDRSERFGRLWTRQFSLDVSGLSGHCLSCALLFSKPFIYCNYIYCGVPVGARHNFITRRRREMRVSQTGKNVRVEKESGLKIPGIVWFVRRGSFYCLLLFVLEIDWLIMVMEERDERKTPVFVRIIFQTLHVEKKKKNFIFFWLDFDFFIFSAIISELDSTLDD